MLTRLSKGPTTPTTDLTALLLECHARIRRLSNLAHRIGTDPEATPSERIDACLAVERYFTEALPLHVQDEEESILPRLVGRSAAIDSALATMSEQHASHEAALDALLEACRAVREAPDDETRRRELARAANVLSDAFDEHLGLEEAVILPAISAHLSATEQAEIVEELRSRRRPGAA